MTLLKSKIQFLFILSKTGRFSSGFFFVLGLVSITFVSNCKKPTPTEKDCVDVHMHNVNVIASDSSIPEEEKALILRSVLNPKLTSATVASCMQSKTKKQIQCEMNAKSFLELRACGKKEEDKK